MSRRNCRLKEGHETFLRDVKLASVVKKKDPLRFVRIDDTVQDALHMLCTHRFMSLPVYDHESEQYVGLVNMFDVMTYLTLFVAQEVMDRRKEEEERVAKQLAEDAADVQPESPGTEPSVTPGLQMSPEMWSIEAKMMGLDVGAAEEMVKAQKSRLLNPVEVMMGLSKESARLWTRESSDTLEDLLDIFSKGVHRLLVSGEDGKFSMLSQVDVLHFLVEEGTLEKLNPELLSSTLNKNVIDAFKTLVKYEFSAVPLIDDDGKLVANLSASDLRGVDVSKIELLHRSCTEFLEAVNGGTQPPLVSVTPESTLKETMDLVLKHRIHRVWVVDPEGRPISVVTLTDIIRKFSPYDETFPQASEVSLEA